MSNSSLDAFTTEELLTATLQRLRIQGGRAFQAGQIEIVERLLETYRSIEEAKSLLADIHGLAPDLLNQVNGSNETVEIIYDLLPERMLKDQIDSGNECFNTSDFDSCKEFNIIEKLESKESAEIELPSAQEVQVEVNVRKISDASREEIPHSEKLTALPVENVAPIPVKKNQQIDLTRAQIKLHHKQFSDLFREIASENICQCSKEAMLKSVICLGRALTASSAERSVISTVMEDLKILERLWNKSFKKIPFFGLNPSRTHSVRDWIEASESYRFLQSAQEALDWIQLDPPVSDAIRHRLIMGIAASETSVFRILKKLSEVMMAKDEQQIRINQTLKKIKPDEMFIGFWSDKTPLKEIQFVAKSLSHDFKKAKEGLEKRILTHGAIDEIRSLIEDHEIDDSLGDALAGAIERALEQGVKPSDKELGEVLFKRFPILMDRNEPWVRQVTYEMRKRIERVKSRVLSEGAESEPTDETSMAIEKTDLAEIFTGKKMLFVGGNKGQERRRDELQNLFGLSVLDWPDMEEHSRTQGLIASVDRYDYVVELVRFSRHHYKDVLDEAKKYGKPTAMITGGLGINRIVHDLHNQFVMK